MTVEEFFNEFDFHDGDIIDMRLEKETLTVLFLTVAGYNCDESVPNRDELALYLKVQFHNVADLQTYLLDYKIVNSKKKYIKDICDKKEAWTVSGNGKFLYSIEQNSLNGVIIDIKEASKRENYYEISFICDDVEILEQKTMTEEACKLLCNEIEKDDSPRIL
jgi:hypothetical protein